MRWFAVAAVALPIAALSWGGCATSGIGDAVDDAGEPTDDDGGGTTPPVDAGKDQTSSPVAADPGPGFAAAPVDSAPPPGDGSAASCNSPDTCQTADDIGSVSGDSSSAAKSATGFTSRWMKIKVTEDDHSVV